MAGWAGDGRRTFRPYEAGRHARAATSWSQYSAFRGVCWHKASGKWQAAVTHQGKKHFLGVFDDEAAAARVYDAKAAELRGRKAKLNFPREWQWAGDDSTGAWSRVET